MHASGVRGVLIYCADYKCSHWIAVNGNGAMMGDCLIWKTSSSARRAVSAVPMSGQISAGTRKNRLVEDDSEHFR
jgi:hypothetical protein